MGVQAVKVANAIASGTIVPTAGMKYRRKTQQFLKSFQDKTNQKSNLVPPASKRQKLVPNPSSNPKRKLSPSSNITHITQPRKKRKVSSPQHQRIKRKRTVTQTRRVKRKKNHVLSDRSKTIDRTINKKRLLLKIYDIEPEGNISTQRQNKQKR